MGKEIRLTIQKCFSTYEFMSRQSKLYKSALVKRNNLFQDVLMQVPPGRYRPLDPKKRPAVIEFEFFTHYEYTPAECFVMATTIQDALIARNIIQERTPRILHEIRISVHKRIGIHSNVCIVRFLENQKPELPTF